MEHEVGTKFQRNGPTYLYYATAQGRIYSSGDFGVTKICRVLLVITNFGYNNSPSFFVLNSYNNSKYKLIFVIFDKQMSQQYMWIPVLFCGGQGQRPPSLPLNPALLLLVP
jgi:hypothetical protein